MSNSSEVKSDPRHDLLTQLLGGIARECAAIGMAISKVGDDLSGALTDADLGRVMVECQSFDRLSQIAHAQARLIEHVGHLLMHGGATSSDDLLSAIDHVPTHDVRTRLSAAIGARHAGTDASAETFSSDDDGIFF